MKDTISSLASKLVEALPEELKKTSHTFKTKIEKILRNALIKMEFVTREEFETQVKALEHAQEKLAKLTEQIAELEKKTQR